MATIDQINEAIAEVCVSFDYELRQEQTEAIRTIVSGKNCIVTLPTGFGKSEIYALAPLVMDRVNNTIIVWTLQFRTY